jgi:predicted dehydrogenase
LGELRVGLIGVGLIGKAHRATIERIEGARLVATADVVPGRANYLDWRAMLDRERLDAVVICTPPLHHREPAVAAAEAGLAFYLEKPVAAGLDDAREIAARASKSGVVCAVGYQYRALDLPVGLRARVLLGRGLSDAFDRPWFGDPAQGGSQILERASHMIDLQRRLSGEVERVAGAEQSGVVSLILAFTSGALGTMVVGRIPGGPGWSLDVVCDDGTLAIDLDPEPSPLETSLRRFLEAVRSGDPARVYCSLDEGVKTLEVALACERAVQSGGTVAVGRGRSQRKA